MTGGRVSGPIKTRAFIKHMKTEEVRLMVAAHALNGLLASQEPEKGWEVNALSVVSLKIADRMLHFAAQPELPSLSDGRDEAREEPTIVTPNDNILTPPGIVTP